MTTPDARSWLDFNTFGLRLMYEQAQDIETIGRAVEAFLEVARLSGELKLGEGGAHLLRAQEEG
jgi:hypothetical protein